MLLSKLPAVMCTCQRCLGLSTVNVTSQGRSEVHNVAPSWVFHITFVCAHYFCVRYTAITEEGISLLYLKQAHPLLA